MDLNRVTVYTTQEALELVGYTLEQAGIPQYELVEDSRVVQQFLDETAASWDYVEASSVLDARQPCVRAFLSTNQTGMEQLRALREAIAQLKQNIVGLDAGSLDMQIDVVHEEDWANNWKQYYKPTPIGKRLLIKPSWETCENPENRLVLNMDPGMVFGTGTHETTQLSLLALEEFVRSDMRVLDLGCGSGILAIGALLLGADQAVGVDIDPNAKDIAYVNLQENGFGPDRCLFLTGNVLEDEDLLGNLGQADLVVANIVAGVIIPLAEKVPRLLKPDGVFITSGIISERQAEVETALRKAGLEPVRMHEKNDWVCLAAKKAAK